MFQENKNSDYIHLIQLISARHTGSETFKFAKSLTKRTTYVAIVSLAKGIMKTYVIFIHTFT